MSVLLPLLFLQICDAHATDFQMRLLLHKQAIFEGKGLGVAGWFVVPDITTTRPLKNLIVFGPCFKNDQGWIEAMGGVLITGSNQSGHNFQDN